MMAMVSAMAGASVESEIGRLWRMAGDAIEIAIPLALTAAVVIGLGWVVLNPTP